MPPETPAERRPARYSIPLIYAVVSAAWIVTSDSITTWLGGSPLLHSGKGVLFVIVTSVMLHALIVRYTARVRRYEIRMHESEQLKALGQLAAVISHELRNVLMAAKAMAAVLRRFVTDAPQGTTALRHLDAAVRRGELLLSEILAFASPRPAQSEPVTLEKWLPEFVELARHTTKPNVSVDLADVPAGLVVHADPAQLEQLLTNLVMNANDASTDGGHITIAAAAESIASVAGVTLTVRDDGAGLDPEVARRVFEPLFTTKAKGTGLGLAIVQRIATAHGGSVTFESAPGRGTAFRVFFPDARREPAD